MAQSSIVQHRMVATHYSGHLQCHQFCWSSCTLCAIPEPRMRSTGYTDPSAQSCHAMPCKINGMPWNPRTNTARSWTRSCPSQTKVDRLSRLEMDLLERNENGGSTYSSAYLPIIPLVIYPWIGGGRRIRRMTGNTAHSVQSKYIHESQAFWSAVEKEHDMQVDGMLV